MSDYSVYDIEYKSPYEDEIIFDGENISIINNSHYKKAAINKYLKIISEENQQDIINNISIFIIRCQPLKMYFIYMSVIHDTITIVNYKII